MSTTSQSTAATATITTTTPVTWASGDLFDGWLLVGIAMPKTASGASYAKVTLWGINPPQTLPQWTMIPIVQGVINSNTTLFQTTYLDPPGCQYAAYWLDSTKTQISPTGGLPTLFTITGSTYTIAQPTLATPTNGTAVPAPQTTDSSATYATSPVYLTPTQEIPSGTVDGSNTVFTLSRTPNFLMFMIDGQVQDATQYTIMGTTVTLTTAPTSGAAVRAIVF